MENNRQLTTRFAENHKTISCSTCRRSCCSELKVNVGVKKSALFLGAINFIYFLAYVWHRL